MEMSNMTTANNNIKEAGKLTEAELAEFTNLRQTASQLVQQLGALEMRKSKMIADVDATEKKAQALLAEARKRIGLGEDQPWQILEDGRIMTIDEPASPSTQG